MSDVILYALLAVGIAAALDLWLMRRVRRYRAEHKAHTASAMPAIQPASEPTTPEEAQADTLSLTSSPTTSPSNARSTLAEPSAFEIDLRIRIPLSPAFRWAAKLGRASGGSVLGSAWAARDLEHAGWILGSLGAAAASQVLVHYGQFGWGIGLYVAAAVLVLAWSLVHPASRSRLADVATLSRRAEIWLVILVIVLAAMGRYYQLDQRIYGLDGDEKSWTLQSYFSVIRGEERGDFADRHFVYQPVTFYLQGWAMQLFGINLLTPRYLNATMSLMAVALFYLLMRRAASPPAALIGTLLAALAFIELSASRQAVHDTLIEFWVLLVYFLITEAVHRRDGRWFLAAGIAATIGMSTYETFYLTPVVALCYLIVCAVRDYKNWKDWGVFIVVFVLPMAFAVSSTMEYINTRQGYHLGAMRGAANQWPYIANRVIESFSTLFYAVKYPDQLVRWGGGPIMNIWLLPFFVIGLVYALVTWRTSNMIFLALWFVIQFFPFAALGAPFPRVYYPAMMAAHGLAALGLLAALKATRQRFPRLSSRALLTSLAVVLIGLVLYDVRVFSAELADPDEQQKRRELSDLIRASVSQSPITYLPYVPLAGDTIDLERNLAEFSAAGARGAQRPTDYYTLVEFGDLMGRIWDARTRYSTANIIMDKTANNDPNRAQRTALLNTLRWCYPRTEIQPGRYFDIYRLSAQDLLQPVCFSTNALLLLKPEKGALAPAGKPVSFEWRIDTPPQAFRLLVEQRNPKLIWLEAESQFSQDQGWYREARFAADYSGTGYLADNWHVGPGVAQVSVTQAGKYRLWVRTNRRTIDDQHTFIAVNNERPVEIASTQQALSIWVWQMVDDYVLEAGRHQVSLSRTYGTGPHYSVFIDAVALSADPAFDPNVHTPWLAALDTGQQPFATSFTLQPGLEPGQYRWRVEIYDGDRLVNGQGQRGVSSPTNEFYVTPEKSP